MDPYTEFKIKSHCRSLCNGLLFILGAVVLLGLGLWAFLTLLMHIARS